MARKQKNKTTPATIEAPKAIIPLMQAFHVDSEKIAKNLVMDAANTLYGSDLFGNTTPVTQEDVNAITSLMREISPRDSLETLLAAQIVVGHMLGMRRLAKEYSEDLKLGLNLLRFSAEVMQILFKKRLGGMQNISVNYNYGGQGNSILQAVMPNKELIDADQGG